MKKQRQPIFALLHLLCIHKFTGKYGIPTKDTVSPVNLSPTHHWQEEYTLQPSLPIFALTTVILQEVFPSIKLIFKTLKKESITGPKSPASYVTDM